MCGGDARVKVWLWIVVSARFIACASVAVWRVSHMRVSREARDLLCSGVLCTDIIVRYLGSSGIYKPIDVRCQHSERGPCEYVSTLELSCYSIMSLPRHSIKCTPTSHLAHTEHIAISSTDLFMVRLITFKEDLLCQAAFATHI